MELSNSVSRAELNELLEDSHEDWQGREAALRREINRRQHPQQGKKRGKRVSAPAKNSKPESNHAAI